MANLGPRNPHPAHQRSISLIYSVGACTQYIPSTQHRLAALSVHSSFHFTGTAAM
ncbi:hypothetical protein GE21DRAFT_1277809 [Neurospora crassa]|nr:hypothetical protein GE21DRAFT_1277809 [Neurospora crassa]